MPTAFDLSPYFAPFDDSPTTGSFNFANAAMQESFDLPSGSIVAFMDDQSPIQGYWGGRATNYGAMEVLTTIPGVDAAPFMSGSWFGSLSNWSAQNNGHENHGKLEVVSDSNPYPYEGINEGEYNPFPYPPAELEEPQKIRDATRFQKSYSFNRHQPVRIRVFKR